MQILNWRRHLKKMRNGYYEIDGVVARLVRYRFIGNTYIKVEFTSRNYEFEVEEAPAILATWRPVNEDGKVTYDHIAEEQAFVKAHAEAPTVEAEEIEHDNAELPAIADNAIQHPGTDQGETSLQEAIEDGYRKAMESFIKSAEFANDKLQAVIRKLNDEKGAQYVPQAKQVINAFNAASKNRDGLIEFFKTGVALTKTQTTKDNKKSSSGE